MTELIEQDQILVPVDPTLNPASGDVPAGYKAYAVLELTKRLWRSSSGFGLSPLHFIDQRGPYQDGSTPLDMRLDPRTIQVVIEEQCCTRTDYWDRRAELLDLLRPNRSLNGVVRPLIYRKWLPGGQMHHGTDGVGDGTTTFTSVTGRFVDRGLEAGATLTISGAPYTVASVPNDGAVVLTSTVGAETGLAWRYRRGWAKRDLYCLLEAGPRFDEGPGPPPRRPLGFREALRFVAHDPCWYSAVTLSQTWGTALTSTGDLVFDYAGVPFGDFGAWFGPGTGPGPTAWTRWLFDYSSLMGAEGDIVYWGTFAAKPTIVATGPATSVVVENQTTDVNITLNTGLAIGETVTIDTLDLTVTSDVAGNLLPYMSGDLATMSIEPCPQAPARVNAFVVTILGAMATSAAAVTWKNRYIGI